MVGWYRSSAGRAPLAVRGGARFNSESSDLEKEAVIDKGWRLVCISLVLHVLLTADVKDE